MCDVFFDTCRDLLLSKFDWPFARRYKKLQLLDATNMVVPEGEYVYQLPEDCRTPWVIQKRGNDTPWCVMGSQLYCKLGNDVYLYYTAQETNPSVFTDTFVNLLSLLLAVKMGPALTQDKDLIKLITGQYGMAQAESWESDANVGDSYREHDEDPNNDTFVNPPGSEKDNSWYNR